MSASDLIGSQRVFARSLVERIKTGKLEESFHAVWGTGLSPARNPILVWADGEWASDPFIRSDYDALVAEGMLRMNKDGNYPFPKNVKGHAPTEQHYACSITQRLLEAVKNNFGNQQSTGQEQNLGAFRTPHNMTIDLFISHSSKDADVALALIEFR